MTASRHSPVYRAVNKPLTVAGVERRIFGIVMIGSLLVLIAIGMTPAALTFGFLFFLGRWMTRTDHRFPQIVLAVRRFRKLYDPAKREWYSIR